MNFALTEVIKDGIVVNLVTLFLETWSGSLVAKFKPAGTDAHLSVSRIGLIVKAVLLESDNSVEYPHLFVAVGSCADATFEFQVKDLSEL